VNAPERWRVELTRPAERDIRRLDRPVADRIVRGLDALAAEPPAGDIKRLSGVTPPQWRLRVGDWRVRFSRDPESRTILVLRVLPRGRAYRD
jgi:mRNA interferase RelE/StbE